LKDRGEVMITTHEITYNSARYQRMGRQQRERIHQGSLEILARVGIEVHDPEARDILVSGGARVDGIRVKISEYMVSKALVTAPKTMTLYDRMGRVAMRAGGYNAFFGGGSDCLYTLDHRTGQRRRAVLSDVIDATIVQDALPEFDFVMSMFLPSDRDPTIYEWYQMELMLNHTTKPIVYVTPDLESCIGSVEMCEVVTGSAEAFRERPFAACYINLVSGLIANEEATQKCIYLSKKGLPMFYIPVNAGGVNAPHTTAGCLASLNAGGLLGIVLSQLVNEGTPIGLIGWGGGPYNLKTMMANYVQSNEQGVATEMGRYYDVPVFGLAGCSDSKVLDQQCAIESTLSLVTALLHGGNVNHDVGFMEAGLQGSLQLQVMCSDTLGWLRAATAGVEVNEETLAVDVIEELGSDGSYLDHPHTLKHFREPYYSKLVDKGPFSQWEQRGSTTMGERAAAQVKKILDKHKAEPLPPEVQRELKSMVAREQKRIDNAG
jgi:trimethylamine--corrinoid protein Co-methyltransferase